MTEFDINRITEDEFHRLCEYIDLNAIKSSFLSYSEKLDRSDPYNFKNPKTKVRRPGFTDEKKIIVNAFPGLIYKMVKDNPELHNKFLGKIIKKVFKDCEIEKIETQEELADAILAISEFAIIEVLIKLFDVKTDIHELAQCRILQGVDELQAKNEALNAKLEKCSKEIIVLNEKNLSLNKKLNKANMEIETKKKTIADNKDNKIELKRDLLEKDKRIKDLENKLNNLQKGYEEAVNSEKKVVPVLKLNNVEIRNTLRLYINPEANYTREALKIQLDEVTKKEQKFLNEGDYYHVSLYCVVKFIIVKLMEEII